MSLLLTSTLLYFLNTLIHKQLQSILATCAAWKKATLWLLCNIF